MSLLLLRCRTAHLLLTLADTILPTPQAVPTPVPEPDQAADEWITALLAVTAAMDEEDTLRATTRSGLPLQKPTLTADVLTTATKEN